MQTKPTTKNINVSVTPEVHKAAKLLCVQRGLTQAQLIEQLIKREASK